jgi:hypothetical protein
LKEVELQKRVRNYLSSKPLTSFVTKSGRSIQIISPGIINVNEGPDYHDFAFILNGKIIVGDAEFHRKSSEWEQHQHNKDENYNNVILHIVFADNTQSTNPDILVLNENEVLGAEVQQSSIDASSYEEIQHFALLRLLRKSSEAQKNINKNGQRGGIITTIKEFLLSYISKRRRPVYTQESIVEFIKVFDKSVAYLFLENIIDGVEFDIYKKLEEIAKAKIHEEGTGLRTEILINCVLPLALCLGEAKSRMKLLEWYWSAKAINNYGILDRKFETLSQSYVWQQQGMLEYLKDYGTKRQITAEAIQDYGIHHILEFYRYGKVKD